MAERTEICDAAAGDPCKADHLENAENAETTKNDKNLEESAHSAVKSKEVENRLECTGDSKAEEETSATVANALRIEVQTRTRERDAYRNKLRETEEKLAALKASCVAKSNEEDDEASSLRRVVEELKNSLAQTKSKLEDRERKLANQGSQINALNKQVSSLKEVVGITKDLLNIRNMEVQHLQKDVDAMEGKIAEERSRHKAMLNKMDEAVRLNADLKQEYQTQLNLFRDLRGTYEEKVHLLSEANRTGERIETPTKSILQ